MTTRSHLSATTAVVVLTALCLGGVLLPHEARAQHIEGTVNASLAQCVAAQFPIKYNISTIAATVHDYGCYKASATEPFARVLQVPLAIKQLYPHVTTQSSLRACAVACASAWPSVQTWYMYLDPALNCHCMLPTQHESEWAVNPVPCVECTPTQPKEACGEIAAVHALQMVCPPWPSSKGGAACAAPCSYLPSSQAPHKPLCCGIAPPETDDGGWTGAHTAILVMLLVAALALSQVLLLRWRRHRKRKMFGAGADDTSAELRRRGRQEDDSHPMTLRNLDASVSMTAALLAGLPTSGPQPLLSTPSDSALAHPLIDVTPCPICLEVVGAGSTTSLPCGHKAHTSCLNEYMLFKVRRYAELRCPACNLPIDTCHESVLMALAVPEPAEL